MLNQGRNRERGQVMILAALVMTVLMGVTALAVDLGLFFNDRRDLQNAADAAALAGARNLPQSPTAAVNDASQWATDNGIKNGEIESITVSTTAYPNDTINVKVRRTADYRFGRALGLLNRQIKAEAAAQVGSLTGTTGLTPFGVLDTAINYCTYAQITQPSPPASCVTTLKYDVNDVGANIGDLDFDGVGGGANELYEKIVGGNTRPLCSTSEPPVPGCATTEPPKPGNSTGQIREAINWRLSQTTSQCDTVAEVVGPDTNGDGIPEVLPGCNPWGAAASDTDNDGGVCDNINYQGVMRGSCRILAVPVIRGPNLPPPSGNATNVAFALFWLLPLENGTCSGNDCEIKGYFISAEVSVSGLLATYNPEDSPFIVFHLIK